MEVGRALVARFTPLGVTRGDKAYDVHANTYRIDADVIPAFEFRSYFKDGNGNWDYLRGVRFVTDSGKVITNYPDQTYANGVTKNTDTGRLYKKVVRVLKGLRNEMQEKNIPASKDIASFLIESVVWNVPDSYFTGDDLYDVVKSVVKQAWYLTYDKERCKTWCEVNDIKYLFHPNQPWTREKTEAFLWAIREYVGFDKE